ncbi:MAG: TonB-dependent siderophore receptor, partial [Kamptonema sp. SIO4C4]|nr:TonB-dependent siderophore receptor [Kamptonema sp. SIO4C4]
PNTVRVNIVGITALPNAEITTSPQGLALNVTPSANAELIELIVTATADDYQVDNVTTGTRTDTPILDVPQSIQAVPEQVIEDQQAFRLDEALRNISGIAQDGSSLRLFSDRVSIRGFDISRGLFKNGARSSFGGFFVPQSTSNIQQVEVLKGPASVLNGQAGPGGIINIVTKQPLSDPYYEASINLGSNDFLFRPTIDLSGPLNDSETVLYRLNASNHNQDTFVDRLEIDRSFVAPVLSVQLSEDTTLTLEGEYLRDSRPGYSGLPALGTVFPNPLGEIPISRFLGDDTPKRERILGSMGYHLEHDFNENWSIENRFQYAFADIDEKAIFSSGLELDNRTLTRGAFGSENHSEEYTLQTDVKGDFTTGLVQHEFLLGAELRRTTFDGALSSPTTDVPSIDLFNPTYGVDLAFELTRDSFDRTNTLGVYVQDLLSFGEQFKVLLGGRFDLVEQISDVKTDTSNDSFHQQDTKFSPRLGIVYQPTENVSLYGNFSRSFSPSFSARQRNADGTPFEPTTGEQVEVGIKAEGLEGRVSATLAAFHITRQNIVVEDPDRPDFDIQIGERRSQGIELDIAGEVLPGLKLIANYAFTDAEITEDTEGFEGNRPNSIPRHSGSLWATYEVQSGGLQGLGFGAGLFMVGEREGDLDNSFQLPGYVRTDAAVFYRQDNWKASLNVKNLFDVEYFEASSSNIYVFPGQPLTVVGSISVTF